MFIDDDVVPDRWLDQRPRRCPAPGLGDDVVVIGPMLDPPDHRDVDVDPVGAVDARQQYTAMTRGDFEPTARQFYTGNASVPAPPRCRRRRVRFVVSARRGRRARISPGGPRSALRLRRPAAIGYHTPPAQLRLVAVDRLRPTAATMSSSVAMPAADPRMAPRRETGSTAMCGWCVALSNPHVCAPTSGWRRAVEARLLFGVGRGAGEALVRSETITRQALSGIYNVRLLPRRRRRAGRSGVVVEMDRPRRRPESCCANDRATCRFRPRADARPHHPHRQSPSTRSPQRRDRSDVPPDRFGVEGLAARVPGYGNWTIRAGPQPVGRSVTPVASSSSTPCSSTPRFRPC